MKRILHCLLIVILTLSILNAFAKPGFIVTPFSRSLPLAPNSTATVLVVAQNVTGVNQTITNSVPILPPNSGITGSVINSSCGFLSPGSSCEVLFKLQSSNQPSLGNLNVSICSFNGTFCSRILKPIDFSNHTPIGLFITPNNPAIAHGTTTQFYAIALFADSTIQNVTTSVNWSSSDISKAIVSNTSGSEGLATGLVTGNSTISATLAGLSDATTLTVTGATLTSITVTPSNPSAPISSPPAIVIQQFTATGIFSDGSNQDLTSQVIWSSSNTAVAIISNTTGQKGIAATKSVGSTTITATFGATSGSTTLNVTPAVLTSISVTPTNPSISIETNQQFSAAGIYSDNSVRDLTNVVNWSTQSTSIAIVSNQTGSRGNALGVGVGSTAVIATFGSIAGSTNLTVKPAVLTEIDIAPTNLHLPVGGEQSYIATGIYDNGRTQDITTTVVWQSSNTNIVSISNAPGSEGLAHAIQAGTVSISASNGPIVASTNLTVDTPSLVSITVLPSASQLASGAQQQFVATGNFSDGSTRDLTLQVTWSTSDPAIAVVSNASGSKGLATVSTSAPPGSNVIIRASFNGVISPGATITVTGSILSSINVIPVSMTIPNGTTAQFTAIGVYFPFATKDITNEVTWISQFESIATISNAPSSKGLVTGVSPGTTSITAIESGVAGIASLTVNPVNLGDHLQGGIVACLDGGLNNLIVSNADNADAVWGGNGIITNGQSRINGRTNTEAIVTALGPGTYAAGVCDLYEIDSAGNSPCVAGNTCYNDWFLPATNQLSCIRNNNKRIGIFTKNPYWTSTEDSSRPASNAFSINFQSSGQASSSSKTQIVGVRCVRLINSLP